MKDFIEVLNNIVVMLAAIIGGIWVLRRLKRERTDEAALEMMLTHTCAAVGSERFVLFTVQLNNKGRTKIEAKTFRDKDGWIFNDGPEKLRHSCSLQIRRIEPSQVSGAQSLDWFEGGPWKDMMLYRGGMEINVLLEYENPNAGEKVEFWLEPGESYHLGVPVVLPAGVYLAKLTFVGAEVEEDSLDKFLNEMGFGQRVKRLHDENFWSQVYGFSVPEAG